MSKMIVELTWDEENLSEGWMNIDNLELMIYGKPFTRKDLLQVRQIKSALVEANDNLNKLSTLLQVMLNHSSTLDNVLADMDDWLSEHYTDGDGFSAGFIAEYNKRLEESYRSCGWCGGHVFTKVPYAQSPSGKTIPGVAVTYVDHGMDCPFKE